MISAKRQKGIVRWVVCLSFVATVLCMGIGSVWAWPVEIPIDPTRSYLNLQSDPAPAILLADYGIAPGDTLLLETFGYFLLYPGDPGKNTNMGAVFSSSDALAGLNLGVDYVNRIPGAIDAGSDLITEAPGFIPWLFDIPEDFRVDPFVKIQVPTGAQYLFVAAVDAFFLDNSIPPGGDFGVRISRVPEPATLSLLGIGLMGIGLLGWRKKRT